MLCESHTDISGFGVFLFFLNSNQARARDKNMYADICKVFSTVPGNSNKSINAINNNNINNTLNYN